MAQSNRLPNLVCKSLRLWNTWLKNTTFNSNLWVETKEGKLYSRYNRFLDRLDIATIEIKPQYQGEGLFKALMQTATQLPVRVVRIEAIGNERLAESAINWRFEGRRTEIKTDMRWEGVCSVTVDYIKDGSDDQTR